MLGIGTMKMLTILKHHSHRRTLVQNTELSLRRLFVTWICEDSSVQQRSVRIRNHRTNISRAVRLSSILRILQTLEVFLNRILPVHRISLIHRVNRSLLWDAHIWVSENELSEGVIHGETVNGSALHGDDQLCGGTVHGESCSHQLGSWLAEILCCDSSVAGYNLIIQLVNPEDGSDRDASIEVGRSINWVASHGVTGVFVLWEEDGLLLFLGDEDCDLSTGAHGGDEEVVADDIELLLVVTGYVGGSGETGQIDERGAADVVGDGFEGELEGVAEEAVSLSVSNTLLPWEWRWRNEGKD